MKINVQRVTVSKEYAEQRIDNFLIRFCKKIPKSRIYKAIRSGEVRIGSSRISAKHRLSEGDIIRIPPLFALRNQETCLNYGSGKEFPIIYEDQSLLVINKPAGQAVHGGSGITFGIIEELRKNRPDSPFLELVHRLDRDTSGLLMIAKKRRVLCLLQEMLKNRTIKKLYLALVEGNWKEHFMRITLPLSKKVSRSGERIVYVDVDHGKKSNTVVRFKNQIDQQYSLLEIELFSGRTHQIRVHLASTGFPILGDTKYGLFHKKDDLSIKDLKSETMYLHAYSLSLTHPDSGKKLNLISDAPWGH